MPRHFIENGVYIETLTDVPLASRPAGSAVVPQKPASDHQWVNGAWEHIPESPVAPTAVAKLALKLALGQAAVAKITAAMNGPGMGWGMKTRWEDAVEIHRSSAIADHIASALGLDTAAMDALFLAALGETP